MKLNSIDFFGLSVTYRVEVRKAGGTVEHAVARDGAALVYDLVAPFDRLGIAVVRA